jgi:hypothetical protein
MVKNSGKWLSLFIRILQNTEVRWHLFILVIFLLVGKPAKDDSSEYLIEIGMPILLLSLAHEIWQEVVGGTEFADSDSDSEPETQGDHE